MLLSPSGGKAASAEPPVWEGWPALKCWLTKPIVQVALEYFNLGFLVPCCEGHHRIKMQTSGCSGRQRVGGQKGGMAIISWPGYMLVTIRKNLLVHKAQELGFLLPASPQLIFLPVSHPKVFSKLDEDSSCSLIVPVLTQSQMSLLCRPLALFFLFSTFLVSLLL